ncbi:hypothetical protein [Rickettsia endosymbiont of Halotydeus destructor]|uniref:hypothetical protein n=1 Tax=Rickettsia endosymbiont of Halotydeus destructor TaxID=2996754 RepID=UPI003BAFC18F
MFTQAKSTKTTLSELLIKWLEKEGFIEQANSLRDGATTLNLPCKEIGDAETKHIAEALKTNTTLTELNLSYNKIGDEGAIAIGDGFNDMALTSLNLENNYIGDEGAIAIGRGLKNNTILTSLNLHYNQIGYEGAIAIGEGLKSNMALNSLNLWYNEIEEEGAIAIIERIKNNMALTSLNLGRNKIKKEAAIAIIERIKDNMALTSLNLGEVQIGDVKKAIEEKTNYNKALFQKLTSLISHYFLKEEVTKENMNVDYAFKVLTVNKFYKVVNKKLLKENLQKQGVIDANFALEKVDNLIRMKPFTIAGVCKNIQPDTELATPSEKNKYVGHISELSSELIVYITSYLDSTPWGLEVKVLKDKLLLNYPKLLKLMLKEFTLEKTVELSNKLSLDLITQALSSEYDEGEELILGGLMSLEYPEALVG